MRKKGISELQENLSHFIALNRMLEKNEKEIVSWD